MALATRCPHCHTTFRVAADQLKLRGGIVRCGACQQVFDGNAHLVDLEAQALARADAPVADVPVAPVAADPVDPVDPVAIEPVPADPDPVPPVPAPVPADEVPDVPAPADDAVPATSLTSHPMSAPAVPFAPGKPQVWRTAARRAAPEDAATPAPAERADLADPAAAAVVAAQADTAAAADVPAQTPAIDSPRTTYAPAGRVEPRLEPLSGGAPDDISTEAPADSVDADAAPQSPPAAASFMPRTRIVPQPAAREPAPMPEPLPAPEAAPPERIEPVFDLAVDEEIVAQALPDEEHHADALAVAPESGAPDAEIPAAALPLRASAGGDMPAPAAAPDAAKSARARAADARTRRSSLKPTKIEAPRLRLPHDDVDEPEFVKRSRRQEQSGRTRRILMGTGSAVLALVLAGQLVHGFRNTLAARTPALRPALQAACAALGCRVELLAQVDNLVIETGELATLGPDTYSLNTLLRNQGSLVQAWPSIELELTDGDNKAVLRRVFSPAEYLPPGVLAGAGFGARSEQAIRLHFALADVKPSDYHLFVFYP